jgi:predicted DCC family thiol-disulfide oxidoreductase YuxK
MNTERGSVEINTRLMVFDGFCNLCSAGARWVQRHKIEPPFRLVPMQSDEGRRLLTQHGYDPDDPLTFVVLEGDRCLTQSDAWIHLAAAAGGAWRLVHAVRVIPRVVRDYAYRLVARNRYRWFGRRTTCYIPQSVAKVAEGPRPAQASRKQRSVSPTGGDGR